MAVDRFIKFDKEKPDLESIKSVLIAFFNHDSAYIYWDDDRFYINLPGKGSFPFRDLIDNLSPPFREERWIEVYPGNPMGVITRQQDEYTNVLADGIAKMFARFWKGDIDAEGCEPIKEKGD